MILVLDESAQAELVEVSRTQHESSSCAERGAPCAALQ